MMRNSREFVDALSKAIGGVVDDYFYKVSIGVTSVECAFEDYCDGVGTKEEVLEAIKELKGWL